MIVITIMIMIMGLDRPEIVKELKPPMLFFFFFFLVILILTRMISRERRREMEMMDQSGLVWFEI
jgi:hypothetical protein